jgi:hypothetical protein
MHSSAGFGWQILRMRLIYSAGLEESGEREEANLRQREVSEREATFMDASDGSRMEAGLLGCELEPL